MMRGTWKMGLALLGLLVLTGCGVQGRWTLATMTPESAKGKFELGDVTLNKDGTYMAESMYGGKKTTSTGKYEFKDGSLTFMPDKGEKRTYEAKLIDMDSKMQVMGVEHGHKWTATMKRK